MSEAILQQTVFNRVRHFLELIRFSHTIFAMPFALLATIWAYAVPVDTGTPSEPNRYLIFHWRYLLGIVLCMVAARSFAMAVNRLLDHRFDAANPRTANRHLPRGILKREQVSLFCVLCALVFLASTLLFLPNPLPILLSVPVLLFLGGYSLTKRFTSLAHYWLGIALMLAPICAWIALRGQIVVERPSDLMPAVWLGGVVLFWVAGFDIIYACQDFAFDKETGLRSIPAWLGVRGALHVAKLSHLCMWTIAMSMTFLNPDLSLGWIFRSALVVVGGLLWWEHSLVSERSLEKVNIAFFELNSLISIVFLVIGSLDAWLR